MLVVILSCCNGNIRRPSIPFAFVALIIAVLMPAAALTADPGNDKPLDFGFIKNPPGKLVSLNTHRLHVDCRGSGTVTVLFEAGLGGSSMEWIPVQEKLPSTVKACHYDRAGYAWSDPSPHPRHARQLAWEAHQLLTALHVDGPLILVGHSFGGFVVRLLAEYRQQDIIGLLLVDASHEDQITRFEQLGGPSVMPKRGKSFVLSQTGAPENLPNDIRDKIEAIGRMRKTYHATHSELSTFRESGRQVRLRRIPSDVPLIVLRRGKNLYSDDKLGQEKAAIWKELQRDLAGLSARGRLIVATESGHHIHVDEPDLVVQALETFIDEYRKGK